MCFKKKKAARGLRRLSLPPSSYRHMTWTRALYPIRSVQETIQTWAQRPGGHSSASVLAPERRTAAMTSVVYLEMNLQHPHPSDVGCSPQRRAHPCTYRRFLPISVCECRNVCSFKSVSLYVRLSFANVKGLSWTEAPEICSSSSSEQLVSVLTSPHPAASRVLFQPSAPASLHFSSLLFTYQRMYKEQSVKSRF